MKKLKSQISIYGKYSFVFILATLFADILASFVLNGDTQINRLDTFMRIIAIPFFSLASLFFFILDSTQRIRGKYWNVSYFLNMCCLTLPMSELMELPLQLFYHGWLFTREYWLPILNKLFH